MQPTRDLAIVLRSIPYEDRHRIVTALTEQHGVITVLARNSIQSRRFGGSLDVFTAAEWQFTLKPGAEMGTVNEAQVKRAFEGLRKDFDKLALASVFTELVLKLAPPHEACPDLFRVHSNALAALEEASGAEIALLNAYLAKLLQWSGNQPRLDACLGCGLPFQDLPRGKSVSCVIADAGWVCSTCRSEQTRHVQSREGGAFQHALIRVSADAIHDFHLSLSVPIRQVLSQVTASRHDHGELFAFLEALLTYHVPGFDRQPLKSLRFLELGSSPRLQAASP